MLSILYYSLSFLLLYIIYNLYQFYSIVRTYPPGPLPYPVLGNLLMLIRDRKTHPQLAIRNICHTYGKISSFWFGSKPALIIHDLDIAKDAYKKVEFSGRPVTSLSILISGDDFESFGFKDYSKEVSFLRKVSSEAIRHLLSSNEISKVVKKVVEETVELIKLEEHNQKFSAEVYMSQIIIRIMAELSFGRSYSFDDPELKQIKKSLDTFQDEVVKLVLTDFLPLSTYFLTSSEENRSQLKKFSDLLRSSFEYSRKCYKPGLCDNFANSFISARKVLMEEERDSSNFMTDSNLIASIGSLFIGGIDSNVSTFKWIQIILAHYPDVQQKLRQEINEKIGKDFPKIEHRKNLDYLNAFIHETLRFRGIVPIGVFHKTMKDCKIANITAPKDTMVFVDHYAFLNDPKYWKDPEKFLPERFLDSSSLFIANRLPAFIPFSFGKRVCIGDRMAIEMIFLTIVCVLQATDGYQFVLPNGPQTHDLDYDSYPSLALQPKPYKLILKKI